jgi:hypothetical protein
MANTKFDEYSKLFTVKPSQIAEKGLFARKTVPAGYDGVTFRSKDYIIHQLKPGESYFDFFNLPIPAPKVMIHVPGVELTPSTIAVDDSTPAQVAPTEPQVTFADIEILQTDPESTCILQ